LNPPPGWPATLCTCNCLWLHRAVTYFLSHVVQKNQNRFVRSFKMVAYVGTRVAGWFVFNPKIPIWVNFGGP
jgi:hypothetical protein